MLIYNYPDHKWKPEEYSHYLDATSENVEAAKMMRQTAKIEEEAEEVFQAVLDAVMDGKDPRNDAHVLEEVADCLCAVNTLMHLFDWEKMSTAIHFVHIKNELRGTFSVPSFTKERIPSPEYIGSKEV